MLNAFQKRRNLICQRFDDIDGVEYVKPQGAFYLFPDFSAHYGRTINGYSINSSQDLATYLLDDAKVGAVPGDGFGADNHMRFSFATSETEINRGLDRIEKALIG
jgi:aspartate aminotransferase